MNERIILIGVAQHLTIVSITLILLCFSDSFVSLLGGGGCLFFSFFFSCIIKCITFRKNKLSYWSEFLIVTNDHTHVGLMNTLNSINVNAAGQCLRF